jgi:EF-hand domain pair
MSISFGTLTAAHRVHGPGTRTNRNGASNDTDPASSAVAVPTSEPSATVTLSKDGLALANLASEGVAVTYVSGPSLSQLVASGQTPLINSPGMAGDTISQEDFTQLILQAGGTKSQADQLFSTFDQDGDGVVSPSEVLSGLSKAGDNSPFAQTLISLMDKNGNGDGTVSSTEFVRFETELISAEKPSASSAG